MNYIKEIAGRDVGCQACWVDRDGDIQANIGITNGRTGMSRRLSSYRVQISPVGEVTYPNLQIRVRVDRLEMSHPEYNEFLQANFKAILGLIESLLTPDELRLRAGSAAR